MNLIGYVRVSTDEQGESGLSLAAQAAKVRQYADLHEHTLLQVVEEVGSAKTLDPKVRPAINDVLWRVRAKEVDGMIVAKLDRLTRSIKDLQDSLDTSTATGRLMMNFMISVSQWEREVIGERTAAALGELRAQGKRNSRIAPYGYKFEPGSYITKDGHPGMILVEDTKEQIILEDMRQSRDAGLTYREIIEYIKRGDFGTCNRAGKPWTAAAVRKILQRSKP